MRNCAKEIFLRPCLKDLLVLMQLKPSLLTVYCSRLRQQCRKSNRLAGSWLSRLPRTKIKKIEQVRGLSVPNPYHCATDASSLDGDIWSTLHPPAKLEVLHLYRWFTHTHVSCPSWFDIWWVLTHMQLSRFSDLHKFSSISLFLTTCIQVENNCTGG